MHGRGGRTIAAATIAVAVIASGCAKGGSDASSAPAAASTSASGALAGLSAEVASYDLVAGSPNRVLIGLFSGSGLVSYGSVPITFGYVGTAQEPVDPPTDSFDTTGTFILVPLESGHDHDAAGSEAEDHSSAEGTTELYSDEDLDAAAARDPEVTQPTQAKGVYQARDVTFSHPGYWRATASVTLADGTSGSATTTFEVMQRPSYPAPGTEAPTTDNLTIDDVGKDVKASSVDSRALGEEPIPDPGLHQDTVKSALAAGRPVVVVVSTPTYCQSRFCGPITDEIAALQERYGDAAAFVHLEVWRNFDKQVVNASAAEWVYRNDELTEPWVFLVGSDGRVLDRWSNVLDPRELAAELDELPTT